MQPWSYHCVAVSIPLRWHSHCAASDRNAALAWCLQVSALSIWDIYSYMCEWTRELAALWHVPIINWRMWFRFWGSIAATKQAFLQQHGPVMYVFLLAVNPASQGKGLGSHILQAIIGEADQRGLHTYIEASNEGARALFERYGFEQIGRCLLQPHVPCYSMVHWSKRPK